MTEYDHIATGDKEIPSFEPWLRIMCVSFVPAILAYFVPAMLKGYLIGVAVLILGVSLWMLLKQEVRANRRRQEAAKGGSDD